MEKEYQIVNVGKPDNAIWEFIGGGIDEYNTQKGGPAEGGSVCFILYTPEKQIAGGLIGSVHWGWFYINLLFIKEELRGQGYGHRIMTMAEEEARRLGAKDAYLDTFSFQAPEFYKELGYEVFGELKDFPPGHQRYYLKKQL